MKYNSQNEVQSAFEAVLAEVKENMVSVHGGAIFTIPDARGHKINGQPRDLAEQVFSQLLDAVLQGVR